MKSLVLASCLALFAVGSNAQSLKLGEGRELHLVKTDQGCGLFTPGHVDKAPKYQWSGRCINGLAEGFGLATQSGQVEGQPYTFTRSGHRRAGIAIGHQSHSHTRAGRSWVYAYGTQSVTDSERSIFRIRDEHIATPSVPTPEVISPLDLSKYLHALPKIVHNVGNIAHLRGFDTNVWLSYRACRFWREKPTVCQENSAAGAYAVSINAPGAVEPNQVFPCPNLATPHGCEKLFFEKAQPVIDEITSFIRSTRSLVEMEIAAAPK